MALIATSLPRSEVVAMPGDEIAVTCRSAIKYCVRRRIMSDGTIEFPNLGLVAIALRTPTAIAQKIETLLEESTGNSLVRLDVTLVASSEGVVRISGLVNRPSELPWRPGIKLSQALRYVGLSRGADSGRIRLSGVDGEQTVDSSRQDPLLRPGDRIEVEMLTASNGISVLGGVQEARMVDFREGLTLQEAVSQAKGIVTHGDSHQITIQRGAELIPADLSLDGAFLLRPGDAIRVPLREDRRFVLVRGFVSQTGQIPWKEGMRLTQLLGSAGGLTKNAALVTVRLKRTSGQNIKVVNFNLSFVLTGRIPDPVLLANDELEVVSTRGGSSN